MRAEFQKAANGQPPPHRKQLPLPAISPPERRVSAAHLTIFPLLTSNTSACAIPLISVAFAMMSLPTTDDPVVDLSHLLNRLLRVTIPDGRYFIGRFICVDHQMNLVLANAEEFRPDPKSEEEREERNRVDEFMPKSQRGPGEGDGWGMYAKYEEESGDGGREREMLKDGRMLGLVLVTGKDVVSIDLIDEAGGLGGARAGANAGMMMMGDIM